MAQSKAGKRIHQHYQAFNMKGYVKIHRELLDNSIWNSEKFTRGQAWVDLILKANAQSGYVRKRGARIDFERGDVAYSIKELSRQWDWSENKTRRFLNELEDDGMVTLKKTNVSCTITLVNYDMWQSDGWQMRRGNNSTNDAQSNDKTTHKRYPNNKENKKIRIKEESESAHTIVDLKPLIEEFPTVKVEQLYIKFELDQQKNGIEYDDVVAMTAAFKLWIMRAIENGWDKRAPESNMGIETGDNLLTVYCPYCDAKREVNRGKEAREAFCQCGNQMFYKNEYLHEKGRDTTLDSNKLPENEEPPF